MAEVWYFGVSNAAIVGAVAIGWMLPQVWQLYRVARSRRVTLARLRADA